MMTKSLRASGDGNINAEVAFTGDRRDAKTCMAGEL